MHTAPSLQRQPSSRGAWPEHPAAAARRPVPSVSASASLHGLVSLARAQAAMLAPLGPEALADWLYTHWYTALPSPLLEPAVALHLSPLPRALRAALEAPHRWQAGWVVLGLLPQQRCLVGKGALRLLAGAGDFANLSRPGAPPVPGDGVAVFQLLTWVDEATGFFGVRAQAAEPHGPLSRLYWSVSAAQVGAVLVPLVQALEDSGLPWTLKCPATAAQFGRVDSLVVYVQRQHGPALQQPLRLLAQRLQPQLRDITPPLTRRWAPGLGFAEDEGPEHSFGQTRCAALAAGVMQLLRQAQHSAAADLRCLNRALRDHGIEPRQAWRSARAKPLQAQTLGGLAPGAGAGPTDAVASRANISAQANTSALPQKGPST